MNIHFPQVARRSQLSSHIVSAIAILTVLLFVLSLFRHVEFHWPVPSISIQAAQLRNSDMPVAFPAPLPPTEAAQAISTPEPVKDTQPILVPQAVPAPVPSVP
jgi:hypothetical protein